MDSKIIQAVEEVNRKYSPTRGKCMEASNKLVSMLKKHGIASERQAGLYHIQPHNWVVLSDGTILDATADQFGAPLIPEQTASYSPLTEEELSWLSFWGQQSAGLEHLMDLRSTGAPTFLRGGQDLDEVRHDRRGVQYRYVSQAWRVAIGRAFMSAVVYEYDKSKLVGVCANYKHRHIQDQVCVEYTTQTWYYFQPKSGTWFVKKAGKFVFTDEHPGVQVGFGGYGPEH